VASTVPACTTLAEAKQIVKAAEKSGKNYMMMETVVYSREFLYVRELRDTGRLGRIQFMRGSHLQNMEGWPSYWAGLPPMHYATHCVSPCLAIVKGEADYVSCLGSGRIDETLIPKVRLAIFLSKQLTSMCATRTWLRSNAVPFWRPASIHRKLRRLRLKDLLRVATH
jgi:predicted dehydrogenase